MSGAYRARCVEESFTIFVCDKLLFLDNHKFGDFILIFWFCAREQSAVIL